MEESENLRVAVTGGTGMIGQAVIGDLRRRGDETLVLSRSAGDGRCEWNPDVGRFDPSPLEGFDAVIHLAGENIAQRWTGPVRERIYSSRIKSTKLLVDGLRSLENPPKVLLSASGINFYPPTNMGAKLTEEAEQGGKFLSRVCHHWEMEALKAKSFGVRVCLLRTSVVLSAEGGALAKLLPVFKAFAGGPVAPGYQPFPWISIEDYVRVVRHLLRDSSLEGPVNLVSPDRVTNEEFSKTLGQVLGRPSVLKVPRCAVRAVFGEMGRATLTEGVDAVPAALHRDGFEFLEGGLIGSLERLLKKTEETEK